VAEVGLRNATKRFGDTVAIDDLTLTVGDGEFVVLLGPTGAGKTTTLRLIAGIEKPDEGVIEIDGEDATHLAPAVRDVSFVFQQYSLYPHYSVYDNLAFPLRAPGRRASKAEIDLRVREIATLLRIESKLGNRATELSGGEMQRVAIGRALVRTPAIYLMDEPLSSLDAKLREDLRVELKRIQREIGATVLYVTHDQLEAMTMADRIGVLSEGRLVQIGTPRDIYERPDSIYVARRLGSPQINVLTPASLNGAASHAPAGTAQVGVRPEDVVLGAPTSRQAEIIGIERLGVETVLLLDFEGTKIHALMDAHGTARLGETTGIAIRPEAALFFDAAGNRIGDPSPAWDRPANTREAVYD
jgi:multiple sugar transport system ATP-binding protein